MRTLWNLVSILAVTHLLAISMFVGWLWLSGRLDAQRVQTLRELFAQTIEQRQVAEAEQAAQQQAEQREAREQARAEDPPYPSAQQVRLLSRVEEREQQSLRRLQEEKRQLMEQLENVREKLREREEQFAAARRAWDESTKDAQQRKVDEQFAQALEQLELIPPKQAKAVLENLAATGNTKQAVSYIDAMNPRAAAKILREFKAADETQLATKLLERLRTFGTVPQATEDASDDQPADNQQSAEPAKPGAGAAPQ